MSEKLPATIDEVAANEIEAKEEFTLNDRMYSTLSLETFEDKVKAYNALNTEGKLSEHIGEVINMTGILMHEVTLVSEETKEPVTVPRCVIIDDKGVGYAAVSSGVRRALGRIIGMFGDPSNWIEPLKVIPVERRSNGARRYYDLEVTL